MKRTAHIADLLGHRTFGRPLELLFDRQPLDIHGDDPRVRAALANYYREFHGPSPDGRGAAVYVIEAPPHRPDLPWRLKEREPGKRPKEEFHLTAGGMAVRKVRTGMLFFMEGENSLAMGPCLENLNQVVNFINSRFMEGLIREGAVLLHAAGVAFGEGGLALAGTSGVGKSTLALQVMTECGEEADFVSNDRLLLPPGEPRSMVGVAKHPRVNPGTALNNRRLRHLVPPDEAERFLGMTREELWDVEHKYDVMIDECFGPGRFRLRSEIRALVVLGWRRGGGPIRMERVDPARRRDLFPAFMKGPGLFYRGRDATDLLTQENYLAALAGIPLYAVTGEIDFAALTGRLRRLATR